jgi:hypothetical protein
MKAVLALIVIYIGAFLIATQGASQNTAPPARQDTATQSASVDPTKEADIRSLMELVGARDSLQEVASRGAEQFRENLTASVADSERGQKFVNAFVESYKAKFDADAATTQLVAIYDKHFSDDEIKGLLQFYGSPLGQKFVAEMPKVNAETQAASRAFSTRIAKDVLQDLRKQYPGVSAHARLAKPHTGQAEPLQQLAQTQP